MKLTPAMQQFMRIKNENPDSILLFRMGDFYETFFEDAKIVARDLNIVLTARGKDKIPLAGIPFHSIDPYIAKLVKKGHKVAMVEQLEDPKKAKGIVKRGLVRIITPGTLLDDTALDAANNNYLVSISRGKGKYGVSAVDISTGDFLVTETTSVETELAKFNPSEIIVPSLNEKDSWVKTIQQKYIVNSYNDVYYYFENASENLKKQFNVLSLGGFGLEEKDDAISSAGAIIRYLKDTQQTALSNITKINYFEPKEYMIMDGSTIRNLELFTNIRDNTSKGSLFKIINDTKTPMGARTLRKWLSQPLIDEDQIKERLDAVEELVNDIHMNEDIRDALKGCLDVQRLFSRVSNNLNCPKDLVGIKGSLTLVPKLKRLLDEKKSKLLKLTYDDEINGVFELLEKSINSETLSHIREGNVIKRGYSEELDKIVAISKNAKKFILELEEQEKERTGIKSLKIKFNRVFGYFIEITKSNLKMVPDNYIRKQTQVNAERFITDELKEKEELILNAKDKQIELEQRLYAEIVEQIVAKSEVILRVAEEIGILDSLSSLAYSARQNNYVRPDIHQGYELEIKEGRHPVIEHVEEVFIPNNCNLGDNSKMMIITGPNMAGKSSYMRQVALIQILAQIGSFVPAKSAKLPITDRVFTRIGAFDDLSSGQSTFMVEMNETANIVNNSTKNSLIILDEIGRGTSTYDGISLAWAIAEFIINNIKAKTLFTTHYHQLNKLNEKYSDIKNFNISVLEKDGGIPFLHKIEEGGTDKSYGIEVAKLAGLPSELISTAEEVMEKLEIEDEVSDKLLNKKVTKKVKNDMNQLTLNDL